MFEILRGQLPAVPAGALYLNNTAEMDLALILLPRTVAEAIASALELYAGRDTAFIAI